MRISCYPFDLLVYPARVRSSWVNTTAECYGYVAKPFHTNAVLAAIELAMKRREKEYPR